MVNARINISRISLPGSSKIPFHGRYNNHSVIVLLPKFITVSFTFLFWAFSDNGLTDVGYKH